MNFTISKLELALMTPLLPSEVEILANYNSELSRGILHSREWKLKMAELQRRFNIEWEIVGAAREIEKSGNFRVN